MKAQTLIVAAVLIALCASSASAQFTSESFLDRAAFEAYGYFVDVRFNFGSYLDDFLPIGGYFGEDYLDGAIIANGPYVGFDFSGFYETYFNIDTVPLLNTAVVAFDDVFSIATNEYLIGGIGNGYIFSAGHGIGLVFTEGQGPYSIGFFLEAADQLLDQNAVIRSSMGPYFEYDNIIGDTHTQFWGVVSPYYPVDYFGFQWVDESEVAAMDRSDESDELKGRKASAVAELNADFYEDKNFMIEDDPLRAGLQHVLIPAAYVGNLFGERPSATQASKDVDVVVNVVDHQSMSVNMAMSAADNRFTAAGFTLACGAQLLIEAGADNHFTVTLDDSELMLGDVVAERDFTVLYNVFDSMPRTAAANGRSWFDKNMPDEEHSAMVRVANADLVVDVSLSTNNGQALLNVNMRELHQVPTASGLLRSVDSMTKAAAKSERSLTESHMDFMIAANTVDSLF